jgi:predicted MFS family arabinose efflux permease
LRQALRGRTLSKFTIEGQRAIIESGMQNEENAHSHSRLLLLLSVACCIGVSNIYYNQPLLLEMSRSFRVTPSATGAVAVATQVGYSLGILFFVPLADVVERRGLMVRLFAGVGAAALLSALSPTLGLLLAASVVLGLTASVTHVAVAIAPGFAGGGGRGRAVGTVMTGLLLGILLGRAFAGLISEWLGWRAVFYVAAGLNLAFVPLLLRLFPKLPPSHPLPYSAALRSLWTLFREQPVLRESALLGACSFGAFSCFWTTLVFFLGGAPYHMGPGVAGGFGILGATGALIAPIAGRMADRHGTRSVVTLALILLAASFAVLWVLGYHMAGLILGVILLDAGAQANQISNQTRIFGLDPTARGRINTIYMVIYFLGGSLGSLLSTLAWEHAHWTGVCLLGFGFIALGALRHATGSRVERPVAATV